MTGRARDLRETATAQPELDEDTGEHPKRRLAQRLLELAPLARVPPALEESEADGRGGEVLSRLSVHARRHSADTKVSSPSSRGALVRVGPESLPASSTPIPLSRVADPSARASVAGAAGGAVADRWTLGFLLGLSLATAIGIGLYAVLV